MAGSSGARLDTLDMWGATMALPDQVDAALASARDLDALPDRDDIPIMLIDEAETVGDAEHERLLAKAEADGVQPTFAV